MKPFIKWILLILTLLFIVLADVMLLLYKQWPAWVFLIILLVFIGMIFSGLFLSQFISVITIWSNKRYKSGLNKKKYAIKEFFRFRRIEKNWTRSVRKIRKTIYSDTNDTSVNIPRYLIIGASRAGKTTAIKNSHTATPFLELSALTSGQCENKSGWWFLGNAFLLDTPGRYVDQESKEDLAEWRRCLKSIRKTGRTTPLNGIVVCISAKTLLAGGDVIKQEATNLRKCIYETLDFLGMVCPVYVMITQCDAIEGMVDLYWQLPGKVNLQAMGSLKNTESARQFVIKTFELIYFRLSKLRFSMLGSQQPQDIQSSFVFLPEKFLKLKESFSSCAEIIFEKNDRKEHVNLRGIFFSSGQQEQTASSVSASGIERNGAQSVHSSGSRGIFLSDFFKKIMINDRYLARISERREGLHQLAGSLLTVSVVLGSLVLGALLTMSFTQNLKVMHSAYNVMPPANTVNQNLLNNITNADQFRESIVRLDENLNQSWYTFMGLRQAATTSFSLKEVYVRRYTEGVIKPLDALLDKSLAQISGNISSSNETDHITYLARRINLYRSSIESSRSSNNVIEDRKTPDFRFILNVSDIETKDRISAHLSKTYRTYLLWQKDEDELQTGVLADQDRMKDLLGMKGKGLNWLTSWASSQGKSAYPGEKPYWGGSVSLPGGKSLEINFAYTPEGWRLINEVLAEIELANMGSQFFASTKRRYLDHYRKDYFSHWEAFLGNFYRGQGIWTGRKDSIDLAYKLSKSDSPYFRVIHDAAIALEPMFDLGPDATQIPSWANLLTRFIKLSDPVDQSRVMKGGFIEKVADRSKGLLKELDGKHLYVDTTRLEKEYTPDKKVIGYLKEYKETLGNMASHLKTPGTAYQLVRAAFQESDVLTGVSNQSVHNNARALAHLKQELGKGNANEEVFWQLLSNQMNQIWHILLEEAQIYIQQQWENEVLEEEAGLDGWELIGRLQGIDGAVWRFKKGELAPFLQADVIAGHKSRQLYGGRIRFSKKFIGLLNRRALEDDAINGSYSLNISALPTDVNIEAIVKPHETKMTMYCFNGNQNLFNQNYPVSRFFVWIPRDCGDVEILISIGKLELRKSYSGYRAFIRFLDDFHTGKKVFDIDEFPAQRRALEAYSVRSITVAYDISGHERIARLQSRLPEAVPDKIITEKTGYKKLLPRGTRGGRGKDL